MEKEKGRKSSNGHVDHSQRAYRGIRKMFYNGELVPGQKISFRELAERLTMSPTPISQALKLLEFQGLVRHEANRGYYIEPISLAEVEEIYELREILELSLVSETINLLDEDGEKELKKALDAHLTAVREVYLKERPLRNLEFHLTLASLSKRHTQLRVLRNLFDVLFLKYRNNYQSPTSMETSDHQHMRIFQAVVGGDLEGARVALSDHISSIKKQVLTSLTQMLEEKEWEGSSPY